MNATGKWNGSIDPHLVELDSACLEDDGVLVSMAFEVTNVVGMPFATFVLVRPRSFHEALRDSRHAPVLSRQPPLSIVVSGRQSGLSLLYPSPFSLVVLSPPYSVAVALPIMSPYAREMKSIKVGLVFVVLFVPYSPTFSPSFKSSRKLVRAYLARIVRAAHAGGKSQA